MTQIQLGPIVLSSYAFFVLCGAGACFVFLKHEENSPSIFCAIPESEHW